MSDDKRIEEFLKWRRRVSKDLPNLSNRVFALRGKAYSGCGFGYELEGRLGNVIMSIHCIDIKTFNNMSMLITKILTTDRKSVV